MALPDTESMSHHEQITAVAAALRQVMDPEVGIDVVELGLVYGISVTPVAVDVEMTMTSRTCPLGELISAVTEAAIRRALPQTSQVSVEFVWDPPWQPAMMSDQAKRDLRWAA